MLLRWLVGNVVRQQAEGLYQQAMTQAARLASRTPSLAGPVQVPAECHAAVVCALSLESAGLVDKLRDPAAGKFQHSVERFGMLGEQWVRVVETGVGMTRARQGMLEALERGAVPWVVSAGFAGALRPELKKGEILMADSVADLSGESLGVGFRIDPAVVQATPHLHVGRLLSVDHVVSTPAERAQLAQEHQAVACDMETLAIARVCQQQRVRFLSVRVITDTMEDHLPPELEKLLRQKSTAGKLGAAAGAIWQRPGSVKDMWKLRDEAHRAATRLADFLTGVLPQLT